MASWSLSELLVPFLQKMTFQRCRHVPGCQSWWESVLQDNAQGQLCAVPVSGASGRALVTLFLGFTSSVISDSEKAKVKLPFVALLNEKR